jgi:hypothetical protein
MYQIPSYNLLCRYPVLLRLFLALCVLQPIAVRADGSSALGKNWTIRQAPSGLREVAYGAGRFVALGGGKLATSRDGVTWTEQTPPAGTSWAAGIFAQNKFVALSSTDSGEFSTNVMTSSDGLSWSLASDGLPPGSLWASIAYGNGTFVAGSAGTFSVTYMATSPDAVTWTPVTVPAGSAGMVELAFGNGAFVAVQSSNGLSNVRSLFRSTNGTDWQEQVLPSGASPDLFGVTFGRGQFIAVGEGRTIITSPDGITWTNRTEPGDVFLVEVVDAGDTYIAFGYERPSIRSIILTSADGISWTQQNSPSTLSRVSAAYAHGIVVALSALESATETVITSGTFKIVDSIIFRNGSARLSEEAKTKLANHLAELDTGRQVRFSLRAQSTRVPAMASVARRRTLAIARYVRSQRPSKLLVKATTRFSNRVRISERNRVSAAFTYK